jgi:hopanoid biosynthesis associated RND transporter like protein HpnN
MPLPTLLARLVAFCCRFAAAVVLVGLALAALGTWYAAGHLGITTNTDEMFAASLPWRQRAMAFDREFPQFNGLLVAVVDGKTPEAAEATAAELAARLAADTTTFNFVHRPDASPYLAREGLMFLDKPALQETLDRIIDAQPFLGQLVADPSLRGLFSALSLVAMGVQQGGVDLGPFAPALEAFHKALAAAAAGHPQPLSWETLLGGQLAAQGGPYRFVLAQPKLNFGALQPGGAATTVMRDAIAQLEFVKSGQAHVRITGSVALEDEEFATVAQGAGIGLIGSLILVTVWLFLAVGSWRQVAPIVLTLLLGLLLTTGYAALAVGRLNLISVAFAILFVGIAVDFAIQFSVRVREMRVGHPELGEALAAAARRAGAQILTAAAATAAGFLAFVPTDFSGVAELGMIAGAGMLIAFVSTLTFLPACLMLFRPRASLAEAGSPRAAPIDAAVRRRRVPILGVFGALAVLAVVLSPRLTFDSDPLHTKDPTTEAMRTLADLMNNPLTNPYTIDILQPSLAATGPLAEKLRALPLVADVLTLNSFVPEDQQPKLALIADASGVLAPTLDAAPQAAPVTPDDLRLATRTALAQITPALAKLPPDHPLALIAGDLRALQDAPDATLMAANTALTRFLPALLGQLRMALTAAPVQAADVPPDIARDWVLPDGRARLQVLPKPSARGSRGLRAFVAQVQSVAPDAGGAAVTIVATANTIIDAFRSAAIAAVVAITVILLISLRRVRDVALVLAPLLLSGLLTLLAIVLLPLPLNFANIIALPLLLGVGVSFNIYFVMNWRARQYQGASGPLASATARGVVFSALTTGTAFGSLALSHHPGTASLGTLLLLSLGSTLVTTLVFVPSLLAASHLPPEN